MSPRKPHRSWRRRGRRAQVAAVATLLGLLLVVTFIANYLATQLPAQMMSNDLNHEVAVENQLGRYGALLESTSQRYLIGTESTQPVSLGSAAAPPFAPADTAYLGPPVNGTGAVINYTVNGSGGAVVSSTPIAFGSGVVVHLLNSYTAEAEAAYVQGAVVYAQIGGTPIFVDKPDIVTTVSGGALTAFSIWLPQFVGKVPGTSGSVTTNLVSRLISTNIVVASNATHLTVTPGTNVVLTIRSQYAEAWNTYLLAQNWPGVTVTCVGAYGSTTAAACTNAYAGSGAIGQVVLTIPGTNLARLSVQIATFSIGAQ